jgi:hypothetical protein
MTLWTCKACDLIVVPDGVTPEALRKAMEDHAKSCTKAAR